jgi:hypothetical protein
MPLFLFFNTQTLHIKSKTQQHCYVIPKKPYTLAGFEPGSAVSEADAMSTAPRRQRIVFLNGFLRLQEKLAPTPVLDLAFLAPMCELAPTEVLKNCPLGTFRNSTWLSCN